MGADQPGRRRTGVHDHVRTRRSHNRMTVRTVRGWALAILTVLFFAIAGTIGAPAARADGAFTGSDRLTPRPETVAPIGQLPTRRHARRARSRPRMCRHIHRVRSQRRLGPSGELRADHHQRRPGRHPPHRIRGERRPDTSHRPDPRAWARRSACTTSSDLGLMVTRPDRGTSVPRSTTE